MLCQLLWFISEDVKCSISIHCVKKSSFSLETMNPVENFRSVIGIVLNNWTGLKLSISHGYGGPPMECNAKIQDLINMIDEGFSNNSFNDWGDLSDLLSDYMDQVFHTIIEDDSDEELGTRLQELYMQWSNGMRDHLFNYLASLPIKESIERAPPEIRALPSNNDEDDDDDDTIEEEKDNDISDDFNQGNSNSGSSSNVDADGWQVYHNRRHR